jgi:hypothetical protein
MSTTSSSEKNQQWQRQIHVKLSTIFKYGVSDTPQSFGSFFESIGKRYCAVSVLSKYLGYDIATASKKDQNEKNMNPAELRKKVSRYLGENKRVVKDGAYTTLQIAAALQTADTRMRMMLLMLSSTGCRIGSLPGLVLGNLTKLPNYRLYRIVFYDRSNNEYYSFCTREAATSIDSWLFYRQRCGEKISFNETTQKWEPYDTPLFRLQFDVEDLLQVRNPRPMNVDALRAVLALHLVRSGIRDVEHPTATTPNSASRVRKSISLSNGFRKHVISTFIEAGLNHEIRELLCNHATQLDAHYFRPTQEQILQEYLKAESLLTIDPSLRLQREVQTLKVEKSSWEAMRKELDDIKELLKG